jgi:hypothetical protein
MQQALQHSQATHTTTIAAHVHLRYVMTMCSCHHVSTKQTCLGIHCQASTISQLI